MSHIKKWILLSLSTIFASLFAIAGFNYFMDSLWTFNHEHQYNQYQRDSRERQQKSNALYFRMQKYDTLIFGSSRTTHMNPHKWDENTFNYAASDMQPNEYVEYLNFAINEAKQPIKRVVIGLDFFGSLTYAPAVSKDPRAILNKISEPFYRYKLLFSMDTLTYSLHNLKSYYTKEKGKYTYSYVKRAIDKKIYTPKEYDNHIQGGLSNIERGKFSEKYDVNYLKEIGNLVVSNPNIEFIVFTTPVSKQVIELLIAKNLYSSYERWLRENVSVFNSLNHFMYVNDLTKNANVYFIDSHHAYDTTYECVTDALLQKTSNCPTTNMILNKENIKVNLDILKKLNSE